MEGAVGAVSGVRQTAAAVRPPKLVVASSSYVFPAPFYGDAFTGLAQPFPPTVPSPVESQPFYSPSWAEDLAVGVDVVGLP